MASVAVFAALIVALGAIYLPLPFSAVPVTGQTLGVLLAANLLPPRRAVAAVALVLALGALGLPVIAGGRGGIGVLVGPSAGYFAGWLLVAVGVGAAAQRLPAGSYGLPARVVLNCTLGVLLVYLTGVPWLSFLTQRPLVEAITVGALPFLPGDLFKATVAAVVAHRLAGVPVRSVLRVPAPADSR
ncbi:MAG: biotin transporter BioY [Chloroflexi bacterium]|nr:biotin transporter BioY [Chloroflexota bacterium]